MGRKVISKPKYMEIESALLRKYPDNKAMAYKIMNSKYKKKGK